MRVLVVDDDPTMLKMVRAVLQVGGYEVAATDDPLEVEGLLEAQEFAAMVLDRSMPGLSADQLLRRIRHRPGGRALRVLVLSGGDAAHDRQQVLAAGADEFMSKPFDRDHLLATMGRLTQSSPRAPEPCRGELVELLERLDGERFTGRVRAPSGDGEGLVEVEDGRVTGASFVGLGGREALIELILARPEGLEAVASEPRETAEGSAISVPRAVLEAGWIEDGLGRFSGVGDHSPLSLVPDVWPLGDLASERLPVETVLERLEGGDGATLVDLCREARWSPNRLRLTVAWLLDRGVIET